MSDSNTRLESVHTLIQLTGDEESDVRDWSVFGLGVQGDFDSSEIRDALLRCLCDSDEDVREAAVGLGKRQDIRLLPRLTMMLNMPVLNERVAEAASALWDFRKFHLNGEMRTIGSPLESDSDPLINLTWQITPKK